MFIELQVNHELSTISHTVGSCGGHMGMYSSGFLVMPNKLHLMEDVAKFKEIWKNPSEFWKNPVGLLAVGVVFLLYSVLLIWALRRDHLDDLMVCMCYIDISITLLPSLHLPDLKDYYCM